MKRCLWCLLEVSLNNDTPCPRCEYTPDVVLFVVKSKVFAFSIDRMDARSSAEYLQFVEASDSPFVSTAKQAWADFEGALAKAERLDNEFRSIAPSLKPGPELRTLNDNRQLAKKAADRKRITAHRASEYAWVVFAKRKKDSS